MEFSAENLNKSNSWFRNGLAEKNTGKIIIIIIAIIIIFLASFPHQL